MTEVFDDDDGDEIQDNQPVIESAWPEYPNADISQSLSSAYCTVVDRSPVLEEIKRASKAAALNEPTDMPLSTARLNWDGPEIYEYANPPPFCLIQS